MQFTKATKAKAKLRMFLAGPSGSGKTWTALAMARALGKRVALIDTEHHSASKYADTFEFDALNLDTPDMQNYTTAIQMASNAGYDVLIVDSLSHAWYAAQEMVDKEAARMKSANSYMAWGSVTPKWNALLRTIITTDCHVIGTARSKSDYVIEVNDRGKNVPRKVGLAPIMREGAEYEFDVAAEMDLEHRMLIGKTRCAALDGKVFDKPGANVAEILLEWLNAGADTPTQPMTKQGLWNLVKPIVDRGSLTLENVKAMCEAHHENYDAVWAEIQNLAAQVAAENKA